MYMLYMELYIQETIYSVQSTLILACVVSSYWGSEAMAPEKILKIKSNEIESRGNFKTTAKLVLLTIL